MTIRLYNSLTRTIEEFAPADPSKVEMFVCGPTVYDFVHLGNARTFTVFDVVAKWLRHRGFKVVYLQNITDIDDKIIRTAAERGEEPLALAQRFTEAFLDDMRALNNNAVDEHVRATKHIPQVIAQVKTLRDKGHAYLIEGDGWYFDLATFPAYGKLSGRTSLEADDAVSRIDENPNKRNPGDFALWKLSKSDEPSWEDAELGAGRPGWHIEDTAMTEHRFGPQYDLHGGGLDLKFPHHEAEIAQQEAASGLTPFVRHWMHAGFLELKDAKMSKSVGNILSLREALARYSPEAIRFFLLSAHYREPLAFTEASLDAATAATQRIYEAINKFNTLPVTQTGDGGELSSAIKKSGQDVEKAMDQDMNVPTAFGAIFDAIKALNNALAKKNITPSEAEETQTFFSLVSRIFGIIPLKGFLVRIDIQQLVDKRQEARDAKDFNEADRLRDHIQKEGYTIDDTPYGPLIKKL